MICALVSDYENQEKFVETYHVQYSRIQCARFAKKHMDGRGFFGEVLHVCYAPELETVDETRSKLAQRRKEVATRIKKKQDVKEDSEESATKSLVSSRALMKQYCQDEEKNKNKATLASSNIGHLQNEMVLLFDHNSFWTDRFGQIGTPQFTYSEKVNSGVVSSKDLMECSHWQPLNADGQHLINSDKTASAVRSSKYSKTNNLSFVPRPLVIRKQIVFHKSK